MGRKGLQAQGSSLQFSALGFDNFCNMLYKISHGFSAQVFVCTETYGNSIFRSFFVADDKHIGDLLQLRVTHFGVHTLAACVYLGTYTCCLERFQHFVSVLVMAVSDGNDHGLDGSQPDWECSSKMLDDQRHEAFRRTCYSAMDHDRAMCLPIFANVL